MREIKISIETAQRWANGTDEELKGLALQTYPELAKKELPKSWEELKTIEGYFVQGKDSECRFEEANAISDNRNIFATREQAEASIALAQLSQLREVYRNGWKPDYYDKETKYAISICTDKILTTLDVNTPYFLSFQDREIRDLFFENFRDLIEKVIPLMS